MRPLVLPFLAAALASQTLAPPAPPLAPPAAKVATFHLPAGDYSVAELLQQAGQALRRPIATPQELPAGAPLRLQCDLALPHQAWEDVLGALLATRGLVLVRDAAGTGHEVLPAPAAMEDWVAERAVAMTPREVLERSAFAGPVTVLAPTTSQVPVLVNVLRPHLAGGQHAIRFKAVDGGVQFVGMADQVRFALRTIAPQAPDLAATLPTGAAAPWPRPAEAVTHRLAAGSHTAAQVIDRLATVTGRNLVASPAVAADTTPFEVATAIEGDALRFEERLTALLWSRRMIVLQVSAAHRLGEVVLLEPRAWPGSARVLEIRAEELLARPELVAWVTTEPAVGSLPQQEVTAVFRAAAAVVPGANSLTLAATRGGFRVSGLSSDVTAVLQRLEAKKAGK
ncbi:MAG TPA: hypothetical protein VFT55_13935 [Planctomycetota bacterium]|nr:hypothetical protein [Planctomycetota bacterium]